MKAVRMKKKKKMNVSRLKTKMVRLTVFLESRLPILEGQEKEELKKGTS
jgi:hypothetical protein